MLTAAILIFGKHPLHVAGFVSLVSPVGKRCLVKELRFRNFRCSWSPVAEDPMCQHPYLVTDLWRVPEQASCLQFSVLRKGLVINTEDYCEINMIRV